MTASRQYAVLGPLASGAETRAFLGCEVIDGHPRHDRPVVVVWLPDVIIQDSKRVSRLQRETAFVTQLKHPNIIRVYGLEPFEEGWARIVDFVDGEPLGRIADRAREKFRPLDARFAARFIIDICAGVHHAHEEGQSRYAGRPIVHGGLRPDTILVTFSGVAMVTGYGASALAPSDDTNKTNDKLWYLAPEQIIGGKSTASPATDIYAIGALLYELLSGKPPFHDAEDLERAVLTGEPPLIDSAGLPGRLGNIAATALAKRGADRFESVGVMKEAIEQALEAEQIPSHEDIAEFINELIPPESPERVGRARLLESAKDPDAVTVLSRPADAPEGVDADLWEASRPGPVSTMQIEPVSPLEIEAAKLTEEMNTGDTANDPAEAPVRQALPREEETVVEEPLSPAESAPMREAIPREGATVLDEHPPGAPMDDAPTEAADAEDIAASEQATQTEAAESPAEEAKPAAKPREAQPSEPTPVPVPQPATPTPAPAPAPTPEPAEPAPSTPEPVTPQPPVQQPAQPQAVAPPVQQQPAQQMGAGQVAPMQPQQQMGSGQVAPVQQQPMQQMGSGQVAPMQPQQQMGSGQVAPVQQQPMQQMGSGQVAPMQPQQQMGSGQVAPVQQQPMQQMGSGQVAPMQPQQQKGSGQVAPVQQQQQQMGSGQFAPVQQMRQTGSGQVAPLPAPKPGEAAAALGSPAAVPQQPMREVSAITNFGQKTGDSSRSMLYVFLALAVGLMVWMFALPKEPPKGLEDGNERHMLPKELVQAALTKEKDPEMVDAEPDAGTEPGMKVVDTKPSYGQLSLKTKPPVTVYDGNEKLGDTPLTVKLPVGKHKLRFTDKSLGLNIYRVYRIRPSAHHRDDVTFGTARLKVEAPSGAKVFLNARSLGEAPITPVEIFEGRYLLRVTHERASWKEWFDAGPGQTIEFDVKLKK